MPFADLHCHPAFWPFNKRNLESQDPKDHIWNISFTKKQLKQMKKGKRASYAQSGFDQMTRGDVRLVFASMYAVEKGFFMGNRTRGSNADVVRGVFAQFVNTPRFLRTVLSTILSPFNKFLQGLNKEGWARDTLQKMVMAFPRQRINYFQRNQYDYYNETVTEYKLYKEFEGDKPLAPAPITTRPYRLCANALDVQKALGEEQIAVILTIEGFHCLCMEPKPGSEELQLCSDQTIYERIKTLKDEWKVFFVTFSHHFSNGLAGHAHSLPLLLETIANPIPLRNAGIREEAKPFLRTLLSIDENYSPDATKGRRIFIDVKHFSAQSRKEYYNNFIIPYNNKNPNDKIPVIASHVGYYGHRDGLPMVNLDYLIARADKELDDDFINNFYSWNINICDEDVAVITESEGLIGISFDQRILGQRPTTTLNDEFWVEVLLRNILGMVKAARNNVKQNPERVWKCLTIGTDFDGLVDPINSTATSAAFGEITGELTRQLHVIAERFGAEYFLKGNPYTPEEVVRMFCFDNAYNFTLKHFK